MANEMIDRQRVIDYLQSQQNVKIDMLQRLSEPMQKETVEITNLRTLTINQISDLKSYIEVIKMM
ncbi:hypothetical protein [Limibacterium fermenti]|uniref:hypothetical protein n=1 Tax=Limibacterium fermenti TaxID=3229863 RepID=UPI003A716FEC